MTEPEERKLLRATAAKVMASADPQRELAAMDLVGVGVDAADTVLADALVVHEEIGRRLAPVSYIVDNAARLVLHRLGVQPAPASLALDPDQLTWTLEPANGWLAFADSARAVLVARATSGSDLAIEAVPAAALGPAPLQTFDLSFPLAELTTVASGERLATVPSAGLAAILDEVRAFSCAALCAEMVGSAEQCLDDAIVQLKTRRQFGQVIGAFQALQHKAADMAIQLEGMRAMLAALAEPHFACTMANPTLQMAKPYIADGYVAIAETCLQLYGGMGYSWEHGSHRRLRHARRASQMLGSPAALRARQVHVFAAASASRDA
ncbi:MAG: acyl-CoA dehydrogenase family protein [Kofleriaceae bacterium]